MTYYLACNTKYEYVLQVCTKATVFTLQIDRSGSFCGYNFFFLNVRINLVHYFFLRRIFKVHSA